MKGKKVCISSTYACSQLAPASTLWAWIHGLWVSSSCLALLDPPSSGSSFLWTPPPHSVRSSQHPAPSTQLCTNPYTSFPLHNCGNSEMAHYGNFEWLSRTLTLGRCYIVCGGPKSTRSGSDFQFSARFPIDFACRMPSGNVRNHDPIALAHHDIVITECSDCDPMTLWILQQPELWGSIIKLPSFSTIVTLSGCWTIRIISRWLPIISLAVHSATLLGRGKWKKSYKYSAKWK